MISSAVDLADLVTSPPKKGRLCELAAATDVAARAAGGEAIISRMMNSCRYKVLTFVRQVDAWFCGASPKVRTLA
ncbi:MULTISPECIES: hypothetical protein [Sphingobium]|uniref:hypothetical protein n=1 Tax=Sphingobium TaxID=165695 RepID=UPI0015EC985D|nr:MULTISPECIES: hypothetical protein [Sphingobium]MCW2361366.1 hypothetical protein [Sphingobium sp. B10D3B]MCW2401955.1 hypothetical protein [Sphingobium sp. B10D7B]MCW2408934.1 hypothetical protein [Sphingobium xanthum]